MDFIQILAGFLLIGRLVAVRYLLRTAKVQRRLLRLPIKLPTDLGDWDLREVWDFRKSLHNMTIALLIGNLPSIVLDIAVLVGVERTTPYLVVYALANMITMVIAAIMINRMYILSANVKEVSDSEIESLKNSHGTIK